LPPTVHAKQHPWKYAFYELAAIGRTYTPWRAIGTFSTDS
jgi:hypothetical protein